MRSHSNRIIRPRSSSYARWSTPFSLRGLRGGAALVRAPPRVSWRYTVPIGRSTGDTPSAGAALKGRVAAVTGGSRGIGLAIAASLARAGAEVVISGRDEALLIAAARDIERMTGHAPATVAGDVREPDSAQRLVRTAVERFGGLNMLVNNAGNVSTTPSLQLTDVEWDSVVETHLRGTFLSSQSAARHMAQSGGGTIVNMSSIFGTSGASALAAYCAAKGAIDSLTRALAVEWARYRIRVVAVAPAYVQTAMNASALSDEHALERILRRTPLRRLATAGEIAEVVVFLCSDRASYITGAVVPVDGGWTAQ